MRILATLLVLALAACNDAPAAPAGPLELRQRLLLPPAKLVGDPALPDPLAGLGTGGLGAVEDRISPTFDGLLKVSLARHRSAGVCDVMRAVLLRGERRLEIPAVTLQSGDVLSFYTGAFQRRRKRSPVRPKPEVIVRLVTEDGETLEARTLIDPRRPDEWRESRFDLSSLAGRTAKLEVRLGGFWQEGDDHAFLADLALYRKPTGATRRNVVLIWLDKFRADLLEQNGGPEGWVPNLNALAAGSVNFTHARSGANHTRNGVLQTFFSQMSIDGYAVSGDPVELPSLSSVMADAGYYSLTLGTNTYTTTYLPEWGVEQIDARHDRARVDLRPDYDPRLNRWYDDLFLFESQVEPWLRRERRGPFLLNVHYQGGHEPFANLTEAFVAEHLPKALALAAGDKLEALYWLKAKLADVAVGRTVELLKELGEWENSVVVVLADHGTNLGPDHRYFQRGYHRLVRACQPTAMYDEQVRVPLVVHVPGLAPATRDEPVALLDLAPTLLELVGLKAPPHFEGRSFAGALSGGPVPQSPSFFSCESEGIYGVLDGRYKYTYFTEDTVRHTVSREWTPGEGYYDAPDDVPEAFEAVIAPLRAEGIVGAEYVVRRELYDLEADPREQVNLAEAEPDRVARMHAMLTSRLFMGGPGRKLRHLRTNLADEGLEVDLARVGLAFASRQPGEVRLEIEADGVIKLERPTGECRLEGMQQPNPRRIEVRCALAAGSWGGLELYRAKQSTLSVRAVRESGAPTDGALVFGGPFGLPQQAAFADGAWTFSPGALPVPASERPRLGPDDEGLFVYRIAQDADGAGKLTAGLADVFAEWGYAK